MRIKALGLIVLAALWASGCTTTTTSGLRSTIGGPMPGQEVSHGLEKLEFSRQVVVAVLTRAID